MYPYKITPKKVYSLDFDGINLTLMLHRTVHNLDGKIHVSKDSWTVSEQTTGMSVSRTCYATMKEAIAEAEKTIMKHRNAVSNVLAQAEQTPSTGYYIAFHKPFNN